MYFVSMVAWISTSTCLADICGTYHASRNMGGIIVPGFFSPDVNTLELGINRDHTSVHQLRMYATGSEQELLCRKMYSWPPEP